MGGRVAEELVFDEMTSGASSDLKHATRLARLMVCDWGMSEELGPQTFGSHDELMFLGRELTRSQDFSEDTARRIDGEVSRLLRESYERAKDILTQHRDKLELIAHVLIEHETLDGQEFEELFKHGRILTEAERAANAPPAEPPAATPASNPAGAFTAKKTE
jgi:cell division protease FtsH